MAFRKATVSEFDRPFKSFGTITNRSSAEAAQFVHALFDRIENTCPRHVSVKPSQHVALIVFNVIIIMFSGIVADEYNRSKTSPLLWARLTWVGMLTVLIATASIVAKMVGNKVYMADAMAKNEQHFANVFWLTEYLKAFRHKGI